MVTCNLSLDGRSRMVTTIVRVAISFLRLLIFPSHSNVMTPVSRNESKRVFKERQGVLLLCINARLYIYSTSSNIADPPLLTSKTPVVLYVHLGLLHNTAASFFRELKERIFLQFFFLIVIWALDHSWP